MRRKNQKSVYFTEDVEKALEAFAQRYPLVSLTNIVNASVKEYLRLAEEKGVDGNLRPIIITEKHQQK